MAHFDGFGVYLLRQISAHCWHWPLNVRLRAVYRIKGLVKEKANRP